MSNDTQVQALKELVDSAAPFVKLFQQADANRDQPMDGRSNIDAQIAVKDLRRLVYAADAARAAVEASARQLAEQPGFVMVPVEPTPEMLRAVDDEADDKYLARGRAVSAWKAMIAARPLTASPTAPSTEQRPQNCGTGFCSCIECPFDARAQKGTP